MTEIVLTGKTRDERFHQLRCVEMAIEKGLEIGKTKGLLFEYITKGKSTSIPQKLELRQL